MSDQTALRGFFIGLLWGAVAAFFWGPRLPIQRLSQQITRVENDIRTRLNDSTPADPLSEGIAQGKAAARRRLDELGKG